MSNVTNLAASLEAYIRDEIARQLEQLPAPAVMPGPDVARVFTTATAAAFTEHHRTQARRPAARASSSLRSASEVVAGRLGVKR